MNTPAWVVKEVQPRKDYTLLITFADGTKKIYDARPLLEKPIYAQLKNPAFFLKAEVDCDTVVWSDDIDIAPEHLYECSQLVENTSTPDKYIIAIDELIKLRKSRGFTQKELAKAANLTQSAIARLESKTAIPQLDTFLKVAAALNYEFKLVPITK